MNTTVSQTKQGTSEDTKTLVTVLLLIFAYPIGLIVMFLWPRWPIWVKLLIGLPVTLVVLGLLAVILLAASPRNAVDRAQCMNQCQASGKTSSSCVDLCAQKENGSVVAPTETENATTQPTTAPAKPAIKKVAPTKAP